MSQLFLNPKFGTDTDLQGLISVENFKKLNWRFWTKEKRTWIGNVYFVHSGNKALFLIGIRGLDIQNGWKEAEYGSHVEEIDEKTLFLTNQSSFLDHVSMTVGMSTQRDINPERNHDWWIQKNVRITNFRWSNPKITLVGETSRKKQLRAPTTWKDMLKNAWKDIASWQTKRQTNCKKFQAPAWMIITSTNRSLNQLENYLRYAHEVSWNACTWHELEDQTSLDSEQICSSWWPTTSTLDLLHSSQKWLPAKVSCG